MSLQEEKVLVRLIEQTTFSLLNCSNVLEFLEDLINSGLTIVLQNELTDRLRQALLCRPDVLFWLLLIELGLQLCHEGNHLYVAQAEVIERSLGMTVAMASILAAAITGVTTVTVTAVTCDERRGQLIFCGHAGRVKDA